MKKALLFFQKETGQSLTLWAIVAIFNLSAQIIFCRDLAPGEFGTLNTALGVVGLLIAPVLAVNQAFAWYVARPHPAERAERIQILRDAAASVTETFAWFWAAISLVLIFAILPLLDLPRFSLNLFTLLNVFTALGAIVSGVLCQGRGQVRLWVCLLIGSALVRVLIALGLAGSEPWAESGLAAFLLAGFITLIPALQQPGIDWTQRVKTLRSVLDRDFLVYLGATVSVLLGIFLFSSADRIVAQSWFGTVTITRDKYTFVSNVIDWHVFDSYHASGLLGRALFWGTQPFLLLFFAQRSRMEKSTAASLKWFWVYLGALFSGAILLWLLRNPISELFSGSNFEATAHLVPIFALAMLPLGLLQGLGIFALASRRYPECFTLGGCSVGYALVLYLFGHRPEVMPAYMFGGALVALMIVLFIGVVRWGRKQP